MLLVRSGDWWEGCLLSPVVTMVQTSSADVNLFPKVHISSEFWVLFAKLFANQVKENSTLA